MFLSIGVRVFTVCVYVCVSVVKQMQNPVVGCAFLNESNYYFSGSGEFSSDFEAHTTIYRRHFLTATLQPANLQCHQSPQIQNEI